MRHIWFGIIAQTLVFVKSKPYDISYQKCLKMTRKYPNLFQNNLKRFDKIQKRMVLYIGVLLWVNGPAIFDPAS
jgi:hypothetical protein